MNKHTLHVVLVVLAVLAGLYGIYLGIGKTHDYPEATVYLLVAIALELGAKIVAT